MSIIVNLVAKAQSAPRSQLTAHSTNSKLQSANNKPQAANSKAQTTNHKT
jgi:hypothetical protein